MFDPAFVRRAATPRTPAAVLHVTPGETEHFWSFLPRWSYDGSVGEVARRESARLGSVAVPMSDCVGPAIKWAKLCVVVLWLGLLGLVVLIWQTAECTEEGWVRRPSWLWLTFIPVLAVCCGLEFVCFRYTVVPFVQVFQGHNSWPFVVLGVPVSYHVWSLWMVVQSTLARVDMATDSFFAISVLRAEACAPNMDAEIWEVVMRQSCTPFFSGIHLAHMTAMIYLLSITQLVWPLLLSTPGCQDAGSIDYTVGMTTPDGHKPNRTYSNLICEEMVLGDTLMMLAEASQMCTLQNQSPAYPRAKERSAREMGHWSRSLRLTRNALSRGVVRIGLVAFLENSFQIQLQVSHFAINLFAEKEIQGTQVAHINSAVSIISSILMVINNLNKARRLLHFSSEVRAAFDLEHPNFHGTKEAELGEDIPLSHASKLRFARAAGALSCCCGAGSPAAATSGGTRYPGCVGWPLPRVEVAAAPLLEPPMSPSQKRAQLVQEYSAIMKYTRVLQLMVLVLVLVTCYASIKLVMVFRCKDSLWNATGCVDLDGFSFRARDHA